MIKAKKDLGQNFLIDKVALNKIIELINPSNVEHFLEIGPGQGALTKLLATKIKRLDAVELDEDLLLSLRLINSKKLFIHHENILNFNVNSILDYEKIRIIGPYVESVSLEHAFSGKQNLSWKFNDENISSIRLLDISSFEDDFSDYLQFSRTTRSFSPLLGISTTFKNGISTNIRSNITHTLDEVTNGLTYISDNSILTTISYNFSRGIRFTLPFTDRKINLKNNFNITFNMDFSKKIEEGSKDKIAFVEQNFTNTRKGVLRVSYALTNDISGSLFYEYRENTTRLTGKRIDRDFGINLNIAIRGNE